MKNSEFRCQNSEDEEDKKIEKIEKISAVCGQRPTVIDQRSPKIKKIEGVRSFATYNQQPASSNQ
jgi:hypothetical protein